MLQTLKESAQYNDRLRDRRRGRVCRISLSIVNFVHCIFVFIGECRAPQERARCRFQG